MDDLSERARRDQSRMAHTTEFAKRLFARRPEAKQQFDRVREEMAAQAGPTLEATFSDEAVLETIVRRERPVLFVKNDWIDRVDVTTIGDEAKDLVDQLDARRAIMQPLMSLIGRIDVAGFPATDFLGTGWFVDTDIVVTNRHVASLFARHDGRKFVFARGIAGQPMAASLSTLHEFDDLAVDAARTFAVKEVLYIEPTQGPDIAFLKVARSTDGTKQDRITIAEADAAEDVRVFVVGYPARSPRSVIPDQQLMKELYRDRYDVKRAAPGLTMGSREGTTRHDCTTLGGNSGSVVLDLASGEAVGLHFAGLYQETNYAVPASVLNEYVTGKRWNRPLVIDTEVRSSRAPAQPQPQPRARSSPQPVPQAVTPAPAAAPPGAVTIAIPLSITVSLGHPTSGSAAATTVTADGGAAPSDRPPAGDAEAAVRAFWDARPEGVIAARLGFYPEGNSIGDTPYIAASVPAAQISAVEVRGPAQIQGFDVHYVPADLAEQIEAMPAVELVDSIKYDDDARTGPGFSFDPVEEAMTIRAHVGPEYSWDELNSFLRGANQLLVSAIYEFHAPQIKDALEARLADGVSLKLVVDNATFSEVKDEDMEFDRIPVFNNWKRRFGNRFDRIVAPEGRSGLISDSYHIKVTVREDDTFWLSSGNWKKELSQPVITQQERDEATDTDLPGNREWHVVIKNKTLAQRFRNHIQQDFKRSRDLGGGDVPPSKEAADIFVDIPVEEAVEERRPPSRLLKPRVFDGEVKVHPLLTPDHEGAVYSEAVLDLIRSAERSLLFQIPYIGMPSNPREDRGFIDELINALIQKLKTLDDARVIQRVGGSRFSAPTHTAWFFKSKGVDIANRLRQIGNHHTKGMIVDGKRVLLGSHNWSKPGVTLNRDASLIFEHEGIARYYAEAFEIDWKRSNPIRPKRFVKEAVVQEAVGAAPPAGFRRVRLSELLKEDD